MNNHIKLVGATDTPLEGQDREIMVTESFLKAIEVSLQEITTLLLTASTPHDPPHLSFIRCSLRSSIAANREIIEAIRMVREL